ncbi:MAG TPA: magnesium transporter [Pirellulales bacterium]
MLNPLYLPEIREMLAAQDHAELAEFCTTLHPASTAEYMEGLTSQETWEVLQHTTPEVRAEIFIYFPLEKQVEMVETLDRKAMAEFIAELSADDRVDLMHEIDPDVFEELLPLVPAHERREILKLRSYAEGTAGAIMTTEFARLEEDMTLAQVRARLRGWANKLETIYYLYVVDSDDHLRGVISFRDLAMAELLHDEQVKRLGDLIERNVLFVDVDKRQDEVADAFARYDLIAIPVVDRESRLVGIVTHDDVIDVLREEAVADVQRTAAVQPLQDTYLGIGVVNLAYRRGVWLCILFFASLFTAGALDSYAEFMHEHLWMIAFIPTIISTGGNTGGQSATLVISALAHGEVSVEDWRKIFYRELETSAILGGVLACCGFAIGVATTHHAIHAGVVSITVFLVVVFGAFLGSALPLIFRRLGLDPALMSNPLVASISDMVGVLVYMNVARLLL